MTFSVLFTFTDFQLIYVLTRGGPLNATHLMATLSFQRAIPGAKVAPQRMPSPTASAEADEAGILPPTILPAMNPPATNPPATVLPATAQPPTPATAVPAAVVPATILPGAPPRR